VHGGRLRKAVRWTWLLVAVAAVYAGVTVMLRKQENAAAEEAAVRARADSDRKIVEEYGGGELKVLMLYASPPVLKRGDTGLLCYGVANAKVLKIEPDIESVSPSLSRCIEVKPAATTTYKLTATDDKGREETRVVELTVR
jgi:hypothetical protein